MVRLPASYLYMSQRDEDKPSEAVRIILWFRIPHLPHGAGRVYIWPANWISLILHLSISNLPGYLHFPYFSSAASFSPSPHRALDTARTWSSSLDRIGRLWSSNQPTCQKYRTATDRSCRCCGRRSRGCRCRYTSWRRWWLVGRRALEWFVVGEKGEVSGEGV